MAKKFPVGLALAMLAAMGLSFLAGRNSVPEKAIDNETNRRFGPRSAERPSPRRTLPKPGLGAGAGAVTTALQLRDIFKHSGVEYQVGTAMADATLARMNGAEISQLVRDLASAQASTPGYRFSLEINTACSRWAEIDPDAALNFVLSNKQASFRSAAIGSIFAGMAKTDPALARAKLAAIEDPSLREAAKDIMLSALIVARPDDWVAAIKSDPSLAQRTSLGSIASEWAMDDPAKAAERVKQLPAHMQNGAVASIAEVWASKDSRAAMAWANSLTDSNQRNAALSAIAGGLAAHDPDAALASLDSLPPTVRRAGLAAVFRTLVDLDFDEALAKASSLADPDDQKAALKIITQGGDYYAANDPFASDDHSTTNNREQLTALLAKLSPGAMRNGTLRNLGQKLAYCSREEAEEILASYPPEERDKLQSGMLQSLASSDPARALEIYQSTPQGGSLPYEIFSNLAGRDPEAVLKFSLTSESKEEQSYGVKVAFMQFAEDDPLAASRRLAALPPGPLYEGALSSVVNVWAQADLDAARSWVDTLTGEAHASALEILIPTMAEKDPRTAAEMIGDLLTASNSDNEVDLSSAASQLGQSWVKEDPESAGKWINGLPDGDVKLSAIQSMVSRWSSEDFDSAARWIDTLQKGKNRDIGVMAIISSASDRDPATAFELAATISDESQRNDLLERVVSQWKENNPTKARVAVERAGITKAERTRLLQQLE